MIPSQREVIILNRLAEQGAISVDEICTYCDCSQETARRDLRRLEERNLLTRTHGGARSIATQIASTGQLDLDRLMEARVALLDRADVLIVTASETAASQFLIDRARRAHVPVIAEGRHCAGATAAVIIDNYHAGVELGRWVTQYAHRNFGGRAVVLDVGYSGTSTQARSQGFTNGLLELRQEGCPVYHINGQGLRETARQCTADALAVHPDINVIFGVNDDSALGALEAFQEAGLDQSKLLAVSFGLEGDEIRNLLLQGGPLKACVALFPELVSRACVDAAICTFNDFPLPERIQPPAAILTADSLLDYYRYHEKSGEWQMRFDRALQIPNLSPQYLVLSQCSPKETPARIGYVQNFSSHAYYQSMLHTMQSYARQERIALEIIDASHDAAAEMDQLLNAIGRAAARIVDDGDTIILDSGETVQSLAQALRDRQQLTVITNSLSVIQELSGRPHITLIASGGLLRHSSSSFVGPQAETNIRELRADKAFIGATGVSTSFGISNSNVEEAAVKRAMLQAAREAILLVDYTKIGVESLVQVAPIAAIHHLVTNSEISEHERQSFAQQGINVIVADGLDHS